MKLGLLKPLLGLGLVVAVASLIKPEGPPFGWLVSVYAAVFGVQWLLGAQTCPTAVVDAEGWRYLAPSKLERAIVLAALLLLGVISMIGASAAVSDAAEASNIRVGLWAVAATLLLSAAPASFATHLRWNGAGLQSRTALRPPKTITWRDVRSCGYEGWSGRIWLACADGAVIRFSSIQDGAEDLSRTILDQRHIRIGER